MSSMDYVMLQITWSTAKDQQESMDYSSRNTDIRYIYSVER
jgi:hypothetical protein